MKVVIAGSRHLSNYDLLLQAIEESGFSITCIVQGDATGADRLGKRYADENEIPLLTFAANWDEHGKAAGPIRNSEMIDSVKDEQAGFILLWDGKSRGSWDCLKKAYAAGLAIHVKMASFVARPKPVERKGL